MRDPVLPPQLQYPSETAEVKVVESPHLLLVNRPDLRSIQQRRQDDRLVHLQFGAEVETVTIPDCALQTTEGLAGFGNPVGHFVVDLGGEGAGAAQVGEVVYVLLLGAVHVDVRSSVANVGWRLMHNHYLLLLMTRPKLP
nr:unnamed protein product [Spirometra erinaceieuropaei]